MTREQAVAEATRRWGKLGAVGIIVEPREMAGDEEPLKMWWVGVEDDDPDEGYFCQQNGSGESYEAAFLDADRRAK